VFKSASTEISSEPEAMSDVQLPTYVRVTAPLLYKPLSKMSSLIYVAPLIVKSASAIVAMEPKMLEKDARYMVNKTDPNFVITIILV